ncbi:MAG: pyridoxamine 5'-phosphate oxidase, partial [Cellvibrionaceae bacterium]|nr:pyridoxamine 5'-phosphate oxidase [Cellvibrionaceae bacterium]
ELDKRRALFDLHYAGKSRNDMAFRDRLERQFGDRLHTYSSAEGERFDVTATLKAIPDDALIYACGPSRLINAVKKTARELDITHDRIRLELFS